ncbi:MAG TPA: hypothetical protein VKE96_06675 [Vicinamibacterales bacterium]|nr:hypothetical protein [Vicinamibacterales bacterium]
MAGWPTLPEMSPLRRRPLTIPPNSLRSWAGLAIWEFWIGVLLYGAFTFGRQLIVTAPQNLVTIYDFTNCYAAPPIVQPCERVAYRTGVMNVAFNAWCGVLLIGVAAWLLWELWTAVAPKPITDEFLKLLDDSFGRNWRDPRTWPWARVAWAYGFTLVGAVFIGPLISAPFSSSRVARPPTVHVETSVRFRQMP